MNKILLDYMDLYAILSDLYNNINLQNPMSLHEFCNEQFYKYQPDHHKQEDAIKECEEKGHLNTWMPKNQTLCVRCGALNSTET
jgi:hypothetical protein